MIFDHFWLVAFSLSAVTWLGLTIARIHREKRDAAMNEPPSAWRFRAQLPIDLPDPFVRFKILFLAQVNDVMEGTDEGFEVAYFTFWRRGTESGSVAVPAAIVDLPVEGPALLMRERGPGPLARRPADRGSLEVPHRHGHNDRPVRAPGPGRT